MKLKDPSGKIIDDDSFGEWKIQLTMQTNFVSFLDSEEIRKMNSQSYSIEILMDSKTDDIIKEFSESFL